MKARFNGPPGEDIAGVSMYDLTFPRGEWVSIPPDNRQALRKLANHPHFSTQADGSDPQDVEIKREFEAVVGAALKPAEEAHAAETQAGVINLKGGPNGDDDFTAGYEDAPEAGSGRRHRNAQRGGSS